MRANTALTHYLNSLLNNTTKTNYGIVLRDFIENIVTVEDITADTIVDYKNSLSESDKSSRTVAARLSAIRSFCDYCWTQGWTNTDSSLGIHNLPVERYSHAKNISFTDFKKVLDSADTTTLVGVRDYLLIRLIFIYGEPSPALRLPFNQAMHEALAPAKKVYETMLAEKTDIESLKYGYLFFNLGTCVNSNPLSLSACRKILIKNTRKAGLPKKFLDFQAMKRLRARQIYEQTLSEEAVMNFCRHKNIKVTRAFLKNLT